MKLKQTYKELCVGWNCDSIDRCAVALVHSLRSFPSSGIASQLLSGFQVPHHKARVFGGGKDVPRVGADDHTCESLLVAFVVAQNTDWTEKKKIQK